MHGIVVPAFRDLKASSKDARATVASAGKFTADYGPEAPLIIWRRVNAAALKESEANNKCCSGEIYVFTE